MSSEELDNIAAPGDAGEYADDLLDILKRIPRMWGRWIDCGPGWYKLLAETNKKLRHLDPNYEIHQVKEKFGTLSYYWSAGSPSPGEITLEIMHDITSQAQSKSGFICDRCGGFAETRAVRGWYFTACEGCVPEETKKGER